MNNWYLNGVSANGNHVLYLNRMQTQNNNELTACHKKAIDYSDYWITKCLVVGKYVSFSYIKIFMCGTIRIQ
jgi:hypothetical protein